VNAHPAATGPRLGLRLVLVPPRPAAAEQPPVVVCPACRLDFDVFERPGEAAHFAAVHNALHHGRRPEAFLTTVDEPTHHCPAAALGGMA
jgi:hypothetical protein